METTQQESIDENEPLKFGSLGGDGKLDESQLNIALYKEERVDGWMLRFSDFLSAILVKETRQALNSRQFLWTYFALLAIIVVFALITLANSVAQNDTTDLGSALLFGFFCILGFPLAVILPFSTFRSMSKEFEDGTLQMISITTMKPFQIAAGKLGGALLQMLMFVSILAPCMAFTSLLEGITIGQISLALFVAISGSLTLCCIGLFFGCTVRTSGLSIVSNLFLLGGSIWVYGMFLGFIGIMLEERTYEMMTSAEGSVVIYGITSAVLSTGALSFVCATSMVAFDTDNRATSVRIAILVQQFLYFAFLMAILPMVTNYDAKNGILVVSNVVFAHYWLIMGALSISTSPIIGNRVRRSYPSSFLGRSCAGLLMPGNGRAFLFSASNLIGGGLVFTLLILFNEMAPAGGLNRGGFGGGSFSMEKMIGWVVINTIYPLFFLSCTQLFLTGVKGLGITKLNPLFGLLMGAFITFFGALAGYLIQITFLYRQIGDSYSILQCFNWWSTLFDFSRNDFTNENTSSILVVSLSCLIVFVLAFYKAATSSIFVGAATPKRVMRDQRELEREKQERLAEQQDDRFEDLFQDRPDYQSEQDNSDEIADESPPQS